MGSRAIKKELLKAFPMFYFRVRTFKGRSRIDVMKGPVDFMPTRRRVYVVAYLSEFQIIGGSRAVAYRLERAMGVTSQGAMILSLMASHALRYNDPIEIALGSSGTNYEVTYETDSTILINNPDGSKSYRGYDFKRFCDTGRWQLYYDDMPVLYNNEFAENSRQVGINISFTSIPKMKEFIDKICGKAFDERAAVVAKMVTTRHLFGGDHRESWLYRGFTIECDSTGWYQGYDKDGNLIILKKYLSSALHAIDRHLKTS